MRSTERPQKESVFCFSLIFDVFLFSSAPNLFFRGSTCLWQHDQHGRTRAHVYRSVRCSSMASSQRVGALLFHRVAWVEQRTSGSRLTPIVHRCPIRWLWVAHVIGQHSTQCGNTPNMLAEQCRSSARVVKDRREPDCVGKRDDESVMHRQRQGTLPKHDHHLCSDSGCWKKSREIVTRRSFD